MVTIWDINTEGAASHRASAWCCPFISLQCHSFITSCHIGSCIGNFFSFTFLLFLFDFLCVEKLLGLTWAYARVPRSYHTPGIRMGIFGLSKAFIPLDHRYVGVEEPFLENLRHLIWMRYGFVAWKTQLLTQSLLEIKSENKAPLTYCIRLMGNGQRPLFSFAAVPARIRGEWSNRIGRRLPASKPISYLEGPLHANSSTVS